MMSSRLKVTGSSGSGGQSQNTAFSSANDISSVNSLPRVSALWEGVESSIPLAGRWSRWDRSRSKLLFSMSLERIGPGGVAPRSSDFSLDDSREGESALSRRSSSGMAKSDGSESLHLTARESSELCSQERDVVHKGEW